MIIQSSATSVLPPFAGAAAREEIIAVEINETMGKDPFKRAQEMTAIRVIG